MSGLFKNEPCPTCGHYANRGVSVDAVILEDEKVLLIKRGVEPHKGLWATPGGYVEWDESAEDAVRREVKEETGLRVQTMQLVGVNSLPHRHPQQVINILYRVSVEQDTPTPGDDAEAVEWFSLHDLPEHMAFDHKQNIINASGTLRSKAVK